ncbi:glycosyltransferase family 1 protein [Paenibacillus sp. ACRRX]|uniref:glycosyltransferase family 1 protein n=1 Tax=unclassified Paenibacillus TaxID=185978 RepID=UPI001EF43D9E|nr:MULTISPECIES: glycosyltransferase family 1 protein [unclassified Paenibacillus]MCG7406100.1 glycosyltransferase family 1 protein [Paenibacillus sp. ACRRX]MDK8182555.1 glycosyltransferase family 1 protein [Paenibacillus sp. UMB4589-SE434]
MTSGAPRRILHVFSRLDRGGAETRMMDVFRHMDRTRLQFDFLVLEPGQHHYDEEIEQLGGKKYMVRHPKRSGIFAHLKDMYQVMKREGPYQAVHAHTAHHAGLAMLAARLAGVTFRVCHARTSGTSGSMLKRFSILFGRLLMLRYATRLLAISCEAGRYLFGQRAVDSGKVEVVPNAIDLSPYCRLQEIEVASSRRYIGIPDCQLLLGHIGRLHTVKNHVFLFKLLAHLRDSQIDARLVLIGGGALRKQLEQQAEDNGVLSCVHFLGVRTDIPPLLRLLDVFVMPSFYEGLGGAAIEAQAAGIPCVLSSSLPEEVDMKTGLVRFLSLHQPIGDWGQVVREQATQPRPSFERIYAAFFKRGFLLEQELDQLQHAYGLSTFPQDYLGKRRIYEV